LAKLRDIVQFLDETLNTRGVPEPYGSNGLQIEASDDVQRIGFAVDASEQTFEELKDCQLVVVHHGLFWPKISRITGGFARMVGQLFGQRTSLYASHLPLDVHSEYGNNAQIVQALGLERGELFPPVGYLADVAIDAAKLHEQVRQTIWDQARWLDFGPPQIHRIAVSSGQASVGMVDQAVEAGAQVLLTGEAGHPIYHAARQAGIHVILAGHYQTEVFGVRALMPILHEKFATQTVFADIPTGF
jgi:dinuclear metal center YbgI/SA1388 family protein